VAILNGLTGLASKYIVKFNLKSTQGCIIGIIMKKLFLSMLLTAFAVAAQAGGEECAKAEKSACPAQQTKSSSCCSGAVEQTKANTCPAMKKSTETTSKKLQSPKETTTLAKK